MGYTSERNNQIVLGLLKYHGIKRIVASPGATNVSLIASMQNDSFFELYSAVDERSAAYMACGMAAELGEPVVLSCTGATASRNYLPALTEAYYRHLPILAVTSTMPVINIGHNKPQCIDRTNVINDTAKLSVHVPIVKSESEEWVCNLRVNEAILELTHGIPGPVHINLETEQAGTFDSQQYSPVRPVDRLTVRDKLPQLSGKIAVFVGAHARWSKRFTEKVDEFCEKYNAVIICDHTSNYKGKYRFNASIVSVQTMYRSENLSPDVLIHIGDISGAYISMSPKSVWRVSPDGQLCDSYRKLRYVFEMDEEEFFGLYNSKASAKSDVSYYESCIKEYNKMENSVPELPFSNMWIARNYSGKLPEKSVLHLGILNSLRSWNFFGISDSVDVFSNTGGFGIDGCLSSALGAAVVSPDKTFFCILGDLAFFYDMNSIGNRHLPDNLRVMVVNNGMGQEFKNYGHRAAQFGKQTESFIAAAGHFGMKSPNLIRNYSTDLGFDYLAAADKDELHKAMKKFLSPKKTDRPVLLEVFTNTEDETEAMKLMGQLVVSKSESTKQMVKNVIGEKGLGTIKKFLKK